MVLGCQRPLQQSGGARSSMQLLEAHIVIVFLESSLTVWIRNPETVPHSTDPK